MNQLFALLLLFLTTAIFGDHILVSIAPQKFFAEQIVGNTLEIDLLVPPGASPHSYEPTPKQIMNAAKATLFFTIGEPFEKRAIEVLTSHNPNIVIVDTRQNIQLLPMAEEAKCSHCAHHAEGLDTHIWLSPKLAKIQVQTMLDALTKKYPENKTLYEDNAAKFSKKLDQVDQELTELFQNCHQRMILVSHPAFGYFCKDYNLTQISLEIEGKELSARQLTTLIHQARKAGLTRVFTQEQYQNKGAHLIAKELKAEIYTVDPYAMDYLNNLRTIGKLFCQVIP